MSKINYLANLSAARAAGQQNVPDLEESMANVRQYADRLKGLDKEDLRELDDLMDKVDSLAGIFEKYSTLQGKIESLQSNAAAIEQSLGELVEVADEADVDPFAGYTEEQSFAINSQLSQEFADGTRLSRDLLSLSEAQILTTDIPDDVPAFDGITKEQTVQVYMQVIDEFKEETELSKRLAYNAGV